MKLVDSFIKQMSAQSDMGQKDRKAKIKMAWEFFNQRGGLNNA